MTVDTAHGGPEWRGRSVSLPGELGSIWGDYAVSYEWGRLRSVLLHCPGPEVEGVRNPASVLWDDLLNPGLAREQHHKLGELYESLGVTVHQMFVDNNTPAKPNSYFVRDLFTMTPQGAVVSRPASSVRAGEECVVAKTLALLNVPILLTVYGDALLEGPDIVLVNSDLAFVGVGLRTNDKGADMAIRLLRELGYAEVIKVQTTFGCGHLDGVMSIVSKDVALIYPTRVSYLIYETLKRHGFSLLELPDRREAEAGMAINLVPVEQGCVIMPAGNPRTKKILSKAGITCHEIDVSELMKGGGAVHCMTGVLKRDGS